MGEDCRRDDCRHDDFEGTYAHDVAGYDADTIDSNGGGIFPLQGDLRAPVV